MKKKHEEYVDFIQAAGAVYAWMCASDARITLDESEGFLKHLNDQPYLDEVSREDFEKSYLDIFNQFQNNFEEAYKIAVTRIQTLKHNRKYSEELVRIARRALTIDGKMDDIEENVLKEICGNLDVDESTIA